MLNCLLNILSQYPDDYDDCKDISKDTITALSPSFCHTNMSLLHEVIQKGDALTRASWRRTLKSGATKIVIYLLLLISLKGQASSFIEKLKMNHQSA